jgi:hypothetical protein
MFHVEYEGRILCVGTYDQCVYYIRKNTNLCINSIEVVSAATNRFVSWSI